MNRLLPQHSSSRSGFTLVELLVAITIFAILSTIAVSAYRGITDSDRLRNGAQQIQSAVNGSRSRALKDKLPRGVRFRVNNGVIDSLIYIGSMPNFIGNSKTGVSLIAGDYPAGSGSYNGRRLVAPQGSMLEAELRTAYDAGAFRDLGDPSTSADDRMRPLRIQLPQGGQWHRIQNIERSDANGFFSITLAEPFNYVSSTGPSYGVRFQLEVGPTPLPGVDPIPLPQNIAIPFSQFGAVTRDIDVMFGPGGIPVGQNSTGILKLLMTDRRDFETGKLAAGKPDFAQRIVTYLGATGQTYVSDTYVDPTESVPAQIFQNYFYYANQGQEAKQ